MTDPGASSSGPSSEANQTEQKIQALRNAFGQVEHFPKSSSWMTSFLFGIVRIVIDAEWKETVAGGHNNSFITIRKIKSKIRDASWFITEDCTKKQAAIEELQRLLDSFSECDISKTYLHKKTPETDQIVANYLYRNNHFEAGDAFISEAGVPETFSLKSQYKKMHAILKELNNHNIYPAIEWIQENRGHPQLSGSRLKFNFYRQKYLQMLKESDVERNDAADFMKNHLITFGSDYLKEINKLAGCMLWRGRLDKSPYVDLLSSATWENLAKDFTENFVAIAERQPIQALRRAVDQVAHFHTSSSRWPNVLLATVDSIIDHEYLQLMEARSTAGHYDSFTTKITTRIESSFPKADMEHNDNMTKGAMDNLRRLIDSFESNISKTYLYKNTRETDQIVANYLYRNNHFEAGDAFISEAGVPETFRACLAQLWILQNPDSGQLLRKADF